MLILSLALAAAAALPADTLRPAPPAAPPARQEGPAVAVHRQPELPVVALRMALLADDPPGFAGAGHLFQHLHLPALEEQVGRVGGRVQAVRTADAVVYTVTGPAAELEYLATVLRSTLHAPAAGTTDVLSALASLSAERGAERETAPAFVRAALRSRVFPRQTPAPGTPASAARLEVAELPRVWASMYDPDRVSVLAVGDVVEADVRRAFRALPAAESRPLGEEGADSVPGFAGVAPEATRGWLGLALPAGEDASPAALSVAARMLGAHLRRRVPAAQVEVEHWWTHDGQAVAMVAAAPPASLDATRRALATALDSLGVGLTERAAREAAQGVRRDLLFYARTPERMAEVLGAFGDRTGRAAAAQEFYADLERTGADEVRAALAALAAATPVAVDVPPQRTTPR